MHVGDDQRPLKWPVNWEPTPVNRRAWGQRSWRFIDTQQLRSRLVPALAEAGAGFCRVSYSGSPENPGVALYFSMGRRQCVLACDLFHDWQSNLRRTIRYLEELGRIFNPQARAQLISDLEVVTEAELRARDLPSWAKFYGFKAIPERSDLEKAHRRRVFVAHPDRGGSEEDMVRLNAVIEEAREHYDGSA